MLLIPEIQLRSLTAAFVQFIRDDFNDATDKTTTLLYDWFKDVKDGKLDYYVEAQKIFLTLNTDQRHVVVRSMFDPDRMGPPTVHIVLLSEVKGSLDSLSTDRAESGDQVRFSRSFDTTYSIVCTSDNPVEVYILYNSIRAMYIMLMSAVELAGFRNFKLGGRDVMPNEDIVPVNICMRALTATFTYQNSTGLAKQFSQEQISRIIFIANDSGEQVISE